MFQYPPQALVNRPVPKNKVYSFARPGRSVRDRFVQQVADIVWKYKLAPETLNLPPTAKVHEIQIFEVTLKTGELSEDVLRTMDKSIPSLMFFELHHDERVRFTATYKRPSEADRRKSVLDIYFETPWQPTTAPRLALPLALDMATLYEQMLHSHIRLSPFATLPRAGESLEDIIGRANAIRARLRECRQLETRLKQEIQFNRKVEINAALRLCRAQLARLQQQ